MKAERSSVPGFFANNPIIFAVCALFLIVDVVVLDHIVANRTYRKWMNQYESRLKSVQSSNNELNDKYRQLNENYIKLDSMYKNMEIQNHESLDEVNTKVSSLTANLNTCQDTNLGFIAKINENESAKASLENDLHDYEQRLDSLKRLFARQLALEPTWIKAGEAYSVQGDDLAVTVDESGDKKGCPKESPAVVHLESKGGKRDFCLQMDQPQTFTHKGEKLLLHLLGVRENEPPHYYLVSIVKGP
jgi:predicted RNase H-like nuclease (RuvC/YqgF family)